MNFTTVFNQVLILFSVLLIGFIARSKNILNQETNKGLTELLLYVTIPFTIISSFNQSYPNEALYTAGIVFAASFIIHLASIFIGWLLYRKFEIDARKVLWFITVFSNCGFMGFPVLESIYGKIGIFYGSVYNVSFNLFLWTFGQILFTGERDIKGMKKAIINPGIIAVFIGIAVYFSTVKLPFFLSRTIDMTGSLTTPLSMILVGSMLAGTSIRDIFSDFRIYYGTAVRLFLMPLLTLLVMKVAGAPNIVLGVCVISAAMPAAANTVIFAEKFGADAVLASKCVFLSTALSMITIPVMLLLL